MKHLVQDVRFAFRMLVKYPVVTGVIVLSLAAGIGVNVFTFSVVDALLLRPIPVQDYDSLVDLHARGEDGSSFHAFSYPAFTDIRETSTALVDVLAYSPKPVSLSTSEESERVTALLVSENYFSMLGVQPALGRFFRPEEGEVPGRDPVVVLSHGTWRSRFHEDRSVIGRPIKLNGHEMVVIGVAPPGFTGTVHGLAPALWVPLMMQETLRVGLPLDIRGFVWLEMMGRLAPGQTVARAQASLEVLNDQMRAQYPDSGEYRGIDLVPATPIPGLVQGTIRSFLALLFGLTGLMLLTACFNAAGLLLARASSRTKEIAIRLAMGSGRQRLFQQLLTEILVLFLVSGVVAVVGTKWLLELVPRVLAPMLEALSVNYMLDLRMDLRVLGYTLLVCLATGLLFGLMPVLQATRPDVVHELKGEATGLHKYGLRKFLIVGQTAVSLLLLVLAGLLVRGLDRSSSIDPGFDPDGVYIMSLDLARYGYSEPDGKVFYDELMQRVRRLPGVTSASLANRLPLGLQHSSTGVNVPGVPPPPDDKYHPSDQASVALDYFQTMNMPLVRGRGFDERDVEGTAAVAVVNEAFANLFWPAGDAVGQTFYEGTVESGDPMRIVGVTKQGKYRSLDEEPMLYIYRPFGQRYRDDMTLHVRIQGEPGPVLQGIRNEVRTLDDGLALFGVMPLTKYIQAPTLPHRLVAWLAGILGLIGLLLVSIGLYGLISYSIVRRRVEMGVRMAIGAQPSQISRMVLRQGLALSLAGAAIGAVLALLISRTLSSFLFGLDAVDPLTYLGVTALLVGVSLLTTFLPARRAANQNPALTLRDG